MTATITIRYDVGVCVPAGWRSVSITAEATQTSAGMATVDRVLLIDGEEPDGRMSRTGASRQRFNGLSIAAREKGKRKRLSTCRLLTA